MTMRKTPLLLTLALVLLAGCKSSPPAPTPGYLYKGDNHVSFIDWKRVGSLMSGTLTEHSLDVAGKLHLNTLYFSGTADGDIIALTLRGTATTPLPGGEKTILGRLQRRHFDAIFQRESIFRRPADRVPPGIKL